MCLLPFQRSLRVERLGRVAYGPMTALQEQRHAAVERADMDDTLFLLEHEPVVTLGKNTEDGHVLASIEELRGRGVELFRASRGGDVTYHGPGQIVGYPIMQLQEGEQDIRHFVGLLEEVLIRTALDYGIEARRVEGLRGIWVGNDKLAAIGVRVARWVTMHGFALNVSTALDDFQLIVPCGLHGRGVTSLEKLLGREVPLAEVEDRIVHHFGSLFDRRLFPAAASALPTLAEVSATGAADVAPAVASVTTPISSPPTAPATLSAPALGAAS